MKRSEDKLQENRMCFDHDFIAALKEFHIEEEINVESSLFFNLSDYTNKMSYWVFHGVIPTLWSSTTVPRKLRYFKKYFDS